MSSFAQLPLVSRGYPKESNHGNGDGTTETTCWHEVVISPPGLELKNGSGSNDDGGSVGQAVGSNISINGRTKNAYLCG